VGARGRRGSEITLARGAALTLLLVDTTFLISAERQGGALDEVIADDDDVAIAAVTVAELLVGLRLAEGRRRAARQAFIDGVLEVIPTLPYALRVAHQHAELLTVVRKAGRPRGAHDLIIAATALASGRTVLTADPKGFEDLPGVQMRGH
jgi:tRNA(fMet)-specific endonuclease VapC